MKTYIIPFLFFAVPSLLSAQIDVIETQNEKKQPVVFYDSLKNIGCYDGFYGNADRYIGQEIFFVRKVNIKEPPHFKKKGKDPKNDSLLFLKTFIITSTKLISKYDGEHFIKSLVLKDKDSKEIYEIKYSNEYMNTNFVCLGYYEKLKKKFVGKTFYWNCGYLGNKEGVIFKLDNDSIIRNAPNFSKWKCVGVSVKPKEDVKYMSSSKRSFVLDYIGNYICPIILIFDSDVYGKCYCYLQDEHQQEFENKRSKPSTLLGKFTPEDVYYAYQKDLEDNQKVKAQMNAQIESEQKRRDSIELKTERQRMAKLIKRYGQEDGLLIYEGKVKIGWNKQKCLESWGNPVDKNTTTTKYGTYEQWIYGIGNYLYFENGKLTAIQN